MIDDARTTPLGLRLTIQQWPRDTRIRQLARQRGIDRIPGPELVAAEAVPARAFVNHGTWKAWCPDCVGAAEDVWKGYAAFFCMRCGNRACGGSWRPLVWPENVGEIEQRLARLARERRNWDPWTGLPDDDDEARWLEQTRVMLNPDEGLIDG